MMFHCGGRGADTYDAVEKKLDSLAAGASLHLYGEGHPDHVFVVFATAHDGVHSGRRRYLVGCSSCSVLVSEATTGPLENVVMHVEKTRVR